MLCSTDQTLCGEGMDYTEGNIHRNKYHRAEFFVCLAFYLLLQQQAFKLLPSQVDLGSHCLCRIFPALKPNRELQPLKNRVCKILPGGTNLSNLPILSPRNTHENRQAAISNIGMNRGQNRVQGERLTSPMLFLHRL